MPRHATSLHRKRSSRVGYQVRLDLIETRPPIWRRLDLPSDLMLDELHQVIQIAMSWDDAHLHAFSTGLDWDALRFALSDPFGGPIDDDFGDDGPDETEVRLDQVLHDIGDTLGYEYDFGDSWRHRLKLEKVSDRAPDDDAVRLVTGRRACPPEDCGGVWAYDSYQQMAQTLADGKQVDDDDIEILRYVWPTEAPQQILDTMAIFDAEQVQEELAHLR